MANRRHKRNRRGAMAILVLILISVFIVSALFNIDVAYIQMTRTELQIAADASAKAGVEALARLQDQEAAIQATLAMANENLVAGKPLPITRADIEVGTTTQDPDTGIWSFTENMSPYNAIRVRSQLPNSYTGLFMGPAFGTDSFLAVREATAAHVEHEICLVVDRSHSMCFDHTGVDWSYPAGTPTNPDPVAYAPHSSLSRWASLEQGTATFFEVLDTIPDPASVALVTWGSEITLAHYEGNLTGRTFDASVLDVGLGHDFDAIQEKIEDRGDDVMLGGTHMSAGMEMGRDVLLAADTHPYAKKVMILMTDGQWNQGTDPVTLAATLRASGITIHTITFLSAADQTTMQQVADAGGGKHFHANDTEALKETFREIALSLPVVLIN